MRLEGGEADWNQRNDDQKQKLDRKIRGRQSHDADVMRLLRSERGLECESQQTQQWGNNRERGSDRYRMNKKWLVSPQ